MFVNHQHFVYTLPVLMMTFGITSGTTCKFSNENCDDNDECCSRRCVRLHEGTNARCASSPMHYPCFFGYQCEGGLACGEYYSCCSPFWGVCTDVYDCCDQSHVCREESGFIYKRCLPKLNEANQVPVCIYFLLSVIIPAHIGVYLISV